MSDVNKLLWKMEVGGRTSIMCLESQFMTS